MSWLRASVACALLGVSIPALAEDVVLLPHAGDDTLVDAREAARRAVAEGLEAQGMRIVERVAGADTAACETVDCAPALLREAGADLAAAVAVWRDGSGSPEQVHVTLVDAGAHRFPASVQATDGDVGLAARDALLEARALQLLGAGPWIHVRGTPEGAVVLLDGARVGTLPYRGRVDAGRHRLEVRSPGMLTDARTVDVAPSSTRLVVVDVGLTRSAAAAAPAFELDHAAGPTHRPVVGPLVLGAVGLSLGALVTADLLAEDCARREPTGACTRREPANAALAIGFGAAGAAALAGAIVWYFVGGEAGVAESRAGLSPRGAGVSGRF